MCYLGNDLVLVNSDSQLKEWNIKSGEFVKDYDICAHAIHVTEDRKLIVAFGDAFKIRIYDLETEKYAETILKSTICSINSLENGKIVIKHTKENKFCLRIYKIEELKLKHRCKISNETGINCIEALWDSQLAFGDNEGEIKIYSSGGHLMDIISILDLSDAVISLCSLENCFFAYLISIYESGILRLWDYELGCMLFNIDLEYGFGGMIALDDEHICLWTDMAVNGANEKLVILETKNYKVGSVIPVREIHESPSLFNNINNLINCGGSRFVSICQKNAQVFDFGGSQKA